MPANRPSLHALLLALMISCTPLAVQAWDSVGHRLSAAVALEFISAETRDKLLKILTAHPRYEQDFVQQIPDYVDQSNAEQLAQWLLGQAAYWPDIARGLPDAAERRFNRPNWHYIDGAWVRDSAMQQGNVYVGIDPFPPVQGQASGMIDTEAEADNVVTALDYNTLILSDPDRSADERAVALCWVLHLMGDIHQPMHTGSLYSADIFASGDLGGNQIPVGERNLHSMWDRALREFGVADSLPDVLASVSGFSAPRIEGVASDWTAWLAESRQLLQAVVYTPAMKDAVRAADARGVEELPSQQTDDAYRQQMQRLARLRLGLSGLRLAIWFENELP